MPPQSPVASRVGAVLAQLDPVADQVSTHRLAAWLVAAWFGTFVRPRSHPRLARRAQELLALAEASGDLSEPFSTRDLSRWLGVSTQWLEIGRSQGYGPPFVRLGPNLIRYRRGDIVAWLVGLPAHVSTAEYSPHQQAGPGRGHRREAASA